MVIGGVVGGWVNGSYIGFSDDIDFLSPDLTIMPVPNYLGAVNQFTPGTIWGGAASATAPGELLNW